jgi:hypothetical protein
MPGKVCDVAGVPVGPAISSNNNEKMSLWQGFGPAKDCFLGLY